MRQIAILLLLLGTATNGYTQNTTVHPCSNDSTENKKFLVYLDTLDISKLNADAVYDRFFEPRLKDDCFCNLLLYAQVFEYLLDNGLDLNYSFVENTPYINSTNLPENSEPVLKMASNRRMNAIFCAYLVLKLKYDEYVMSPYEKEKDRSLNQDIKKILENNIYSRPVSLEGILSLKNGKAQAEKYEKEVEMILGKD